MVNDDFDCFPPLASFGNLDEKSLQVGQRVDFLDAPKTEKVTFLHQYRAMILEITGDELICELVAAFDQGAKTGGYLGTHYKGRAIVTATAQGRGTIFRAKVAQVYQAEPL